MTDAIVVLVTTPNEGVAAELARTLVEERLAACGNIIPAIRSIYRWEGRVEDNAECLLILKTDRSAFDELKTRVLSLHPYDVPEVLQLEVADGHLPYLDWIRGAVRR